jgi:hypothetical protein
MYQDLKKNFWWTGMKREIAKYVSECDTCQRVKADHLRPAKNLQPLSISEWKWENICMDFIVGLPRISCGYNLIWVIVDRLTKSAHLIPIATIYRVRQYVELYISHIIRYHGIPKTILSDRGSEGPEKATRGGVNGSQSKFLEGTWPLSQYQHETPLF